MYNDPTQPYQPSTSNPYPVYPNSIPFPSSPPNNPPPRRKRLWKRKLGIGCLVVIGLFVFGLCGLSLAAANKGAAAIATPTAANNNSVGGAVIVASPTAAIPTVQPTSQPTSQPTAKPTPKPVPTHPPVPKPKPTQPPPPTGTNGNPWGYNFVPGKFIYSPASGFCGYFTCVSTFWTSTNGYVVECADGHYSHSGGVRGACSHNGGVLRPLYSHS